MRAEEHSRLTYLLEQQGDTVKFTLMHEIDKPKSKFIEAVSNGWPAIFSSLKSLPEIGESLWKRPRRWPEGISACLTPDLPRACASARAILAAGPGFTATAHECWAVREP